MSCSSYCHQGLQSCLEPARLVEPRVLRLTLAPPKTDISRSSPPPPLPNSFGDPKSTNDNVDMGGWSILQSLTAQTTKGGADDQKIYTPPNLKRSSSSMLNEKSLEMCTESLGSETGSDSSDEMALLYSLTENHRHATAGKSKLRPTTRRMSRSNSFPPPLTSISGSKTVQMRPHREGGRLVLKAVSVSSCHAYLRAERIDGRLRLHLLKNAPPDFDYQKEEAEEEEEKQEEEEAEEEEEEQEEQGESINETLVDEENSEGEDGEVEESGGGEMGMEKLTRPSRCKEGGNGSKSLLTNWKPFLVAT